MPPRAPRGGGRTEDRGGGRVGPIRGEQVGGGDGRLRRREGDGVPRRPAHPVLGRLDDQSLLSLGLTLAGFPEFRQKVDDNLKMRRFRAFFGMSPKAMVALYHDLITVFPKVDPGKLLMTMNWLKLYDTEHVMAGRWGLDEETIRRHVSKYIATIQELKQAKIVWGEFNEDDTFIITVDGTHCRIQEVRTDPGAKWYSHKFNAAGVTYELGIAIRSNQLVWINGPFPASQHDITTFRLGLKAMIPNGKRAIGDSGYKGEPTKIAISRDGDSDLVKKFKARAKSRHETFNRRLKSFMILDRQFRHGFDNHKAVFESVCICLQYDIESGHGLFEV
jgi:hypothetical protein